MARTRRPPIPPLADRVAAGKARREACPRAAHAQTGTFDRDSVALVEQGNEGRVGRLVPLRHGRMLADPFAFYRGTALIQAVDLAPTPSSGILVQACGDCHLMNFGGYATPERQLVFDITDFDETYPAPFEWDLKRLVASFAVAARHLRLGDEAGRAAAFQAATSYKERITEFSEMSEIAVWYDHMTFDQIKERIKNKDVLARMAARIDKAKGRTHDDLLPKMGTKVGDRWVLTDTLPTLFHLHGSSSLLDPEDDWAKLGNTDAIIGALDEGYAAVLPPERLALLRRFRLQDVAFKVVGVGSVGTRCLVVLLTDGEGHPLFLQVKQAGPSVLEGRAPKATTPAHAGQRVVEGQRLIQASSDLFLGWAYGPSGREFYVRQLRDMKIAADVSTMEASLLATYAALCGEALARAHAKGSGLSAEISGYLGKNDALADALSNYAVAYANQVERDFDRFASACRQGRLPVTSEEAFQSGLVA